MGMPKSGCIRLMSGYSGRDWNLFLDITRDQEDSLWKNRVWSTLPVRVRSQLQASINKKLEGCGLHAVSEIVFGWRWNRLKDSRDKRRKRNLGTADPSPKVKWVAHTDSNWSVWKDAIALLSLLRYLCSFERSIKKALLLAIKDPRQDWAPNGKEFTFTAVEFGLKESTVLLLGDESRLDNALDSLEAQNMIVHRREGNLDHSEIFMRRHQSGVQVPQGDDCKEAMMFACFFFSGCELTANFWLHGNWALPQFQFLVDNFYQKELAHKLSAALLQSSKFSREEGWKLRAIKIAEEIGDNSLPDHIRSYMVFRKSLIYRISGDLQGAERTIHAHLNAIQQAVASQPENKRLNAIYGLVLHSLAWIHIEKGDFHKAINVSMSWSLLAPENGSCDVYTLRVFLRHVSVRGVARLHIGDFKVAFKDFRAAMGTYDHRSSVRLNAIANLIDVLVEGRRFSTARELANAEFERLRIQPEHVKASDLDDRFLRELLISSAELYVRLGQQGLADGLLRQLNIFLGANHATQSDQQRHIRVLILIAQNIHQHASKDGAWLQASRAWDCVVYAANAYPVMSVSGWDYGLVCFSIHHVMSKLGEVDSTYFQQGSHNFLTTDHFWRRGMSTYWLPYLTENMADLPSHVKDKMMRFSVIEDDDLRSSHLEANVVEE